MFVYFNIEADSFFTAFIPNQ